MIYLKLFWEFLKIGLFSFGGAYGAIPIIKECVQAQGWMTLDGFSEMLAISESTPGPIMVNSATYIGFQQGGLPGAAIATFAVVFPAFLIILLITAWFRRLMEKRLIKSLLQGLAPSLMGIIFATGFSMFISIVLGSVTAISFDPKALLIVAILLAMIFVMKKAFKKKLSPILMIVISAVLGIILY